MKTIIAGVVLASVTMAVPPAAAQMQHKPGMDHRGHQAMGWDQSKAAHTFTTSETGGSIEVAANEANDAVTIAAIRSHLSEITKAFKDGQFDKPLFIHGEVPPGVEALKRLRGEIDYTYEERPAGARVTIATRNAEAIKGIHAFLAYQQKEHKGK